jgi:type VI secretion system protein
VSPLKIPAVALLAVAGLLGCSMLGSLLGKGTPTTSLRSLAVIAEAQANRNSATALDVLFIYDSSALPLLPTSGPAWFAQKDGLTNALGAAADIVSLQVPPPYRLAAMELPARYRHAIRVVAYANYLTPAGQTPINLTTYKHATLTLLADSIECSGA